MEKQTIILTRKIQILVDCKDKEQRSAHFERLFYWQNTVFRAANLAMTHLFVQEQIKDLVYLHDDVKLKLADVKKDEKGMLVCSQLGSVYRLLSFYFKGQLPSKIMAALNISINRLYKSDRLAYWKGEKSLRNYQKYMPIPFSGDQLKLSKAEHGRNFKFVLFKIPFCTYLGKDRSDKPALLQSALSGQIKICASAIQILNDKLFLLLRLEQHKQQHELHEHIIAEASLSVEQLITVSIDREKHQIGNKEEFLYRRLAIQAAMQRAQRAASYCRGGHGRGKKLKCLKHFHDKEKRYVDNRLHLYSRRLIDICVKAKAGTLLLVNQQGKQEIAKADNFLLRNWSYYRLVEKIKYKAERAGIQVIIE